MIVHNRQQLGDVTLPVLMKALNISDLSDTIVDGVVMKRPLLFVLYGIVGLLGFRGNWI